MAHPVSGGRTPAGSGTSAGDRAVANTRGPEHGSIGRELDRRLGGPVGRHAVHTGIWFDPRPWALATSTILWVLTVWQHKPCEQHVAGNTVNAFTRMCYSDVPVAWQNTALGKGASPFSLTGQNWAPLTGLFIWLTQRVAVLFGARADLASTPQQIVNGAAVFTLVAAVLVFSCLLAVVSCMLLMGRDSARTLATTTARRIRSWDALFVAACPVVVTAGLVSWDMFAVALCVAALLAWALDRRVASGVLFGLAVTAGVWPALVVLAVVLACVRSRRGDAAAALAGTTLVTAAGVTAMLLPVSGNPWDGVVSTWENRGPDLGSFWFILKELKLGFTPAVLSLAVAALYLAWVGWVVLLSMRVAPRRPRIAQVAFLLVAGWLVLNKGYAPQQALWLLPLVALARPKPSDWATWVAAEILYWAAVWGHLGTMLSPGDGSPDVVYWAATLFRIVVVAWLCAQVAHDMRHPWDDPVRTPQVDDPIGGMLDHAGDHGARVGKGVEV